jgi:hypothetical protein
MSEAELMEAVIRAARLHGWLVHHDRPGLDRRGRWRTAVQGDAGFPDLVLARAGVVLVVECKSATGRLDPAQRAWLLATGGRVVRPRHLDRMLALLAAPPRTTPGDRG